MCPTPLATKSTICSVAKAMPACVIACDRGYEYAARCGIKPDLLLGDFDSYTGALPAGVEVLRLPAGAPVYRFSGRTAAWVEEHHVTARLSLSHDGGMALAFCVLEQAET